MNLQQLFLARYTVLYDFYIGGLWPSVSDDQMRQRPHPKVNSIAWNLWHLTRVEDATLNRFVADRPQVLDDGQWFDRLNLPWRHNGNSMTFDEVDELGRRINLKALHGYSDAVRDRTLAIVSELTLEDLDAVVSEDRSRLVMIDEGVAHPKAADLVQLYTGWTIGQALLNHGLTHPYQHIGEIGVIAGLMEIEF
jgi:hypothetical protein